MIAFPLCLGRCKNYKTEGALKINLKSMKLTEEQLKKIKSEEVREKLNEIIKRLSDFENINYNDLTTIDAGIEIKIRTRLVNQLEIIKTCF